MNPSDFILLILSPGFAAVSLLAHGRTVNGIGPAALSTAAGLWHFRMQWLRRNAELLGLANVELVHAGIEELPLPDESVDVVISNGVLNFCPDKARVLAEAYRVLRPGGRLRLAGILLDVRFRNSPLVTPARRASEGIPCWRCGLVWAMSALARNL